MHIRIFERFKNLWTVSDFRALLRYLGIFLSVFVWSTKGIYDFSFFLRIFQCFLIQPKFWKLEGSHDLLPLSDANFIFPMIQRIFKCLFFFQNPGHYYTENYGVFCLIHKFIARHKWRFSFKITHLRKMSFTALLTRQATPSVFRFISTFLKY